MKPSKSSSLLDAAPSRGRSRFTRLLSLLSLAVIFAVGCTDTPAGFTTDATLEGEASFISPTWIANNAQHSTLAHELNEVRKATQAYKDVDAARQDGYVVMAPYVPQMGFHLINPSYIAPDENGPFDLTKPPILVYYTTGNYRPAPGAVHDENYDHFLRLGGVEFAHVGDEGAPGTPANIFSDEEGNRHLKVSEEEGWEWVPGPNITAIHAWIHRGNPEGVFHPSNPTIR